MPLNSRHCTFKCLLATCVPLLAGSQVLQVVSLSLLCAPCILYILYLHVIIFLISYEDSVVLLSSDYFLVCLASEVVPVSQWGPVQPSPHLQDPSTGSHIPPFWQLHVLLHCRPYRPLGHAGETFSEHQKKAKSTGVSALLCNHTKGCNSKIVHSVCSVCLFHTHKIALTTYMFT